LSCPKNILSDNNCLKRTKIKKIPNWDPNMWLPLNILSVENNINFFIQSKSLKHIKLIYFYLIDTDGWCMIFNTFNNISVISWRSVLLVVETGVPGKDHQSVASHWQTWSHHVVSSTPRQSGIPTHNFRGDRCWLHR
jgi:hypothetical protein